LKGEIRRDVSESVQLSRVALGWLTPPAYSDDDTVLDVVATLLAGGKATRLYQELVVRQKIASDVTASLDSNQLTSMFGVDAMVAQSSDPKKVERALSDVIKKLGDAGPTEAELDRAKRRIRLQLLDDLQRLDGHGGESGRAGTLQRLNHYLGDPGKLGAYVARVSSVSAADVKRVVTEHLVKAGRVVVTTRPEEQPAAPPPEKATKPAPAPTPASTGGKP
jgi:zinc protease